MPLSVSFKGRWVWVWCTFSHTPGSFTQIKKGSLMFVTKNAARKYCNAHGKQLSKEALFELNCRVENILKSACLLCHASKRISPVEITYAKG